MVLREPLKIHFAGQANLFDSGRHQAKAALASTKAGSPSLPEIQNLLLAEQKQLLELPLILKKAQSRVSLAEFGIKSTKKIESLVCGV